MRLLEHLVELLPNLKIQLFELPDPYTRCCSRILLDVFHLSLGIFYHVVHFNIVVNGKNLSKAILVKHLVDPFRYHI